MSTGHECAKCGTTDEGPTFIGFHPSRNEEHELCDGCAEQYGCACGCFDPEDVREERMNRESRPSFLYPYSIVPMHTQVGRMYEQTMENLSTDQLERIAAIIAERKE